MIRSTHDPIGIISRVFSIMKLLQLTEWVIVTKIKNRVS